MAKVVDFDFASVSSRNRYSWETLFNGDTYRLTQAEDYPTATTAGFTGGAHAAAKKAGKSLKIVAIPASEGADGVYLKATAASPEQLEKFKAEAAKAAATRKAYAAKRKAEKAQKGEPVTA